MADTTVGDGQISTGAVLNDGDVQNVGSESFNAATGGQAYDTTINSGGQQFLMYGGATGTVANTGGIQYVYGTGTATGTVLNGGSQIVSGSYDHYGAQQTNPHYTYGTAYGTVVNNGGYQEVRAYAQNSVINNGGVQFVVLGGAALSDPGAVNHSVVNAGGAQFIYSGTPENTHLNAGGSILLPQLDYTAHATVSFEGSTNMLTVDDGQGRYDLHLEGDYSQTAFTIAENGDYSTFADLIKVTAVPLCFCAGVRLSTPGGDVDVERLCVGDMVLTARGRERPIRWIGSTTALLSARNPVVIVKPDAFAPGVPVRQIRVTPGHSFLFGAVLIPIGALVNGDSIVRDPIGTARFYHIALDTHDVLIAEGAPAESYRDDGNRAGFVEAAGTMPPAGTMPSCAPVVARGPVVERTRRRLAARACEAEAVVARVRAA